MRFGLGHIAPVEHLVLLQLPQPKRDLNIWVAVATAGFEQQDGRAFVFSQPIGEHASRRPGSGDDVVVTGVHEFGPIG